MLIYFSDNNRSHSLLALDINNRVGQQERNVKIIKTLDYITLKAAGIRHQLAYGLHLRAFQSHAACHNKSDITGTQDNDFFARHIAFDIYKALCRTCCENTGRTKARYIKRASRPLAAPHAENDSAAIHGKHTFFAVYGCNRV